MWIKGVYAEPVGESTVEYLIYNAVLKEKLVALYKVAYTELVPGTHGQDDGWREEAYFHGTSHCGCLTQRISNAKNERIPVESWCNNESCATRGILNNGHLITKCPSRGHYFSPALTVPWGFAAQRSQGHDFMSIFICKARNVIPRSGDVLYVASDADIIPHYLAIVKKN